MFRTNTRGRPIHGHKECRGIHVLAFLEASLFDPHSFLFKILSLKLNTFHLFFIVMVIYSMVLHYAMV